MSKKCRTTAFAALLAALTSLAISATADATWSIVLVDTRTREIAIGSATCVANRDLKRATPVMIVGVAGATSQGQSDSSGHYRMQIFDAIVLYGMTADEVMALISAGDGAAARQFGIVDTRGHAATFTGPQTGAWSGGVVGQVGTIAYAVQGNVLTGAPVVDDAVQVILDTPGDLATKLMLSMEAAYTMGGDGRCSCLPADPDGCGAPPPDFEKSAHVGYMLVARLGDIDGKCDLDGGCARGDYYMALNVPNQSQADPDPVIQLRALYDTWHADLDGRPDGLLSTAVTDPENLPADSVSQSTLTITLLDIDSNPISGAIDSVNVEHMDESAGVSSIGTVQDMGGGVYAVSLTAGSSSGLDQFKVTIEDGIRPVQISPAPTLLSRIDGDVNGDGNVDQTDLARVLASFELPPDDPFFDDLADLDGDGLVMQSDLAIVLANYQD